ncbi:hypothetical protein RhiirC2_712313 [Rhizophagus irregularis]|uniref:Crinkler effector protein N-terminal domain-containing protein n=1 Tax=Rhizophagus irregularis TaxID=588596 RepID=A0A2N1N7Q3_9GLOM|nr:hypothetical protein RhiirC2_712313 [Rhizophagus irregularis]
MSIILNCLIAGDGLPDIFKVNIKKEETVGQLIKAIEETRDAGEIKLWKVNIPLAYNNKKLITLINDPIADAREFGGTKLSEKIKISSVFNNSNMSLDIRRHKVKKLVLISRPDLENCGGGSGSSNVFEEVRPRIMFGGNPY